MECNHYIIIGWSEKVLSLIDQLCQGLELSGGTTVSCTKEDCLCFMMTVEAACLV